MYGCNVIEELDYMCTLNGLHVNIIYVFFPISVFIYVLGL